MLVDAHAHLDMYSQSDLDTALAEIDRREMLTFSVSIDAPSFVAAEEIAARSRFVIPSFGIHPYQVRQHLTAVERGVGTDIEALSRRSPCIGEIGLDHRFVDDVTLYVPQRQVFDDFLTLAVDQDKLINVHLPGAEAEAAAMIRATGLDRVIVHWYSGSLDALGRMLNDGWMFTVGVEVLMSKHIRDIAAMIPDDQLLTETDNPGGLEWLNGQIGHPAILDSVIATLAEVRASQPDEIRELVNRNMRQLIARDRHLQAWAGATVG